MLDMLIATGRLHPTKADNARSITAAVARLLNELAWQFENGTRTNAVLAELVKQARLGRKGR